MFVTQISITYTICTRLNVSLTAGDCHSVLFSAVNTGDSPFMLIIHVSHITLSFLSVWSCAWYLFMVLQESVLLVLDWY